MFTSNQIEEIRKKLQLGGAKDTQFPLANSLKGNETIAIVQQGINKQLGLKTLLESVTKWSVSDFLNISKSSEDSYSLEEVLRLIAPINRKAGQVITFKDRMLGTWSIYQFKGESAEDWFNLEYWDDILVKVDNHFKGLILNDCILNETYPKPKVGDFAFVGSTLEEAVVYTCYNYGHWHNTEEPALDINEELKNIVEEVFNNVEKYPELVQLISNTTSIYTVDYNNYTAEDFVKIKETIDKGGIITVSNINIFGLANNNVYHVSSISDYSIVLNALVQNKMVDVSGGGGTGYIFTSVDITFIKTGNKNITKKEFTYFLYGGGDRFLSDDGTYKQINITPKININIGGIMMGIEDPLDAANVVINNRIYNDLTTNGGNTVFYYEAMDRSTMTIYSGTNVPYCVGGGTDKFIWFNCMTPSGFKTIKCKLSSTAITFDSVIS